MAGIAWRALVVAAAVVAAAVGLAQLRVVVLPVILALMVTTVLAPPAARLQRAGLPRLVATWLPLLGAIGLVVGLVALLAPTVADEFSDLGPTLQQGVDEIERWLVEGPLGLSAQQVEDYRSQLGEQLRAGGEGLASGLVTGAVLAGEIVAGLLLALVLVFFFVKDGERMAGFALAQLRPADREVGQAVGERMWSTLSGYVRGLAVVGLVDATIIAVGLLLIGVPLVAPLALLVFFGSFFPLVGAVVAGGVATLVALVSGGPTDALLTLGVVVVVQQVEGDVLAPLVLGRAVRLHPVVILSALTAGAVIGGIAGAFLAVPLTAVVVAAGGELKARGIIGPASGAASAGDVPDQAVEGRSVASGTGAPDDSVPAHHDHEGRGDDVEGGEGGG